MSAFNAWEKFFSDRSFRCFLPLSLPISYYSFPFILYYSAISFLNVYMCLLILSWYRFTIFFKHWPWHTVDDYTLFQSVTLLPSGGSIVTEIFIGFPRKGSMTSLQSKLYRNRGKALMTHSQTREYTSHGILSSPFYPSCTTLLIYRTDLPLIPRVYFFIYLVNNYI